MLKQIRMLLLPLLMTVMSVFMLIPASAADNGGISVSEDFLKPGDVFYIYVKVPAIKTGNADTAEILVTYDEDIFEPVSWTTDLSIGSLEHYTKSSDGVLSYVAAGTKRSISLSKETVFTAKMKVKSAVPSGEYDLFLDRGSFSYYSGGIHYELWENYIERVPVYVGTEKSGISVSKKTAAPGESFKVQIDIPALENADTASIKVEYDSSIFTVTSWSPSLPGQVYSSEKGYFAVAAANAEQKIDLSKPTRLTATVKVKNNVPNDTYYFELTEHSLAYYTGGLTYKELWYPDKTIASIQVKKGSSTPSVTTSDTTQTSRTTSTTRYPYVTTTRNPYTTTTRYTYYTTTYYSTRTTQRTTRASTLTGQYSPTQFITSYSNDDTTLIPEYEPVDPIDEIDEPIDFSPEAGDEDVWDTLADDFVEYEEGNDPDADPDDGEELVETYYPTDEDSEIVDPEDEDEPGIPDYHYDEPDDPDITNDTTQTGSRGKKLELKNELSGLPNSKVSISTQYKFFVGSADIVLTANETTESYARTALKALDMSDKAHYAFDISVIDLSSGGEYRSLADNGYIEFLMPIPYSVSPSSVQVYHIRDGAPELIESTVVQEDGIDKIKFRTYMFSPYMMVDTDAEELITERGGELPNGNVNPHTGAAAIVILPAALTGCVFLAKKTKKRRKRAKSRIE